MTFSSAAYSSPMASQKVPSGFRTRATARDPATGPVEVLVAGATVLVNVVVVADVERRIGEGQVDRAGRQACEAVKAVAAVEAVEGVARDLGFAHGERAVGRCGVEEVRPGII